MLLDTSLTNSIPPVCNQNHHVLQLTHTSYNIISYTQSDTEQQAADGESHQPMFVDAGAKENINGIYSCTLNSHDYIHMLAHGIRQITGYVWATIHQLVSYIANYRQYVMLDDWLDNCSSQLTVENFLFILLIWNGTSCH